MTTSSPPHSSAAEEKVTPAAIAGYAEPAQRPPLLSYLVTMLTFNGLLVELEGTGGPSELEESARGAGARKAIGELLVCPYCLGLWVVAGFSLGLLFAPRPTRSVASMFAALTISDFFQIAYKAAEDKGLD